MILQPITYNGTSLQSTDYQASIPRSQADLQMQTNPSYVKRAGAPPVYSGKDFMPMALVLEIEMQHDWMTLFESLNQLFDTKDETPRQLICQDTEDSNKQYYVYATAKRVQGGNDGPMAVVSLSLDDPIWKSVTVNTSTFATTSATDSTSVTNNGNDFAYPIYEITPTSSPSTDYIYQVPLQIVPQAALAWPNRFLDLTGSTDTTFDTAALVAAGKMLSSGNDLRVFRDGVEVDRWLNGINTTDTHVIVNCDMPAQYSYTLKTAIGSTDSTTDIELVDTVAARVDLTYMPNTGRIIVCSALGATDTEEFTYTAKNVTDTKISLTIDSRAVRGTTALAHSASALIYHVPYDFTLIYGCASEVAPVTDDTVQPLPALTSRNWSFVYSLFYDINGKRGTGWTPHVTIFDPFLSRSGVYMSTDAGNFVNPATALGLQALSYPIGSAYKPDLVDVGWSAFFADYVSSVVTSGQQKQNIANAPLATLSATPNGYPIQTLWSLSEQTSSDFDSWTAWSKASSDATIPNNTIYLNWYMDGVMPGEGDYANRSQIDSITIGLTNYPDVRIRSEQAAAMKLDLTLTNATTGDSMRITYPVTISSTLYVDTDPDFPTCKYNGVVVNGAVQLSSKRAAWLKLNPGANTIQYQTELAVANDVSIAIKFSDRMNFM